ncbi:MAG: hypothetical protein R2876_06930 [Eubacteriales bacterium]
MKKGLIVALLVALLVALTFGGTLAWLTDETGPVVNTFQVGNISIKLTELNWDQNENKIYPGAEISKEPVVTIEADSEDCYVFMQCTNSIPDGIAEFDFSSSWKLIDAANGIYVYTTDGINPAIIEKSENDTTLDALFTKMTIDENVTRTQIRSLTNPKITVQAYAQQSANNSYEAIEADAISWLINN